MCENNNNYKVVNIEDEKLKKVARGSTPLCFTDFNLSCHNYYGECSRIGSFKTQLNKIKLINNQKALTGFFDI